MQDCSEVGRWAGCMFASWAFTSVFVHALAFVFRCDLLKPVVPKIFSACGPGVLSLCVLGDDGVVHFGHRWPCCWGLVLLDRPVFGNHGFKPCWGGDLVWFGHGIFLK